MAFREQHIEYRKQIAVNEFPTINRGTTSMLMEGPVNRTIAEHDLDEELRRQMNNLYCIDYLINQPKFAAFKMQDAAFITDRQKHIA